MRTLLLLTSLSLFAPLLSNPKGMHGDAKLSSTWSTLTVETAGKQILNWDSFSIKSSETTTFIQSGEKAAVLNRVTGKLPSTINGYLLSNGPVYLINSRGIVIGKKGRIETAGFLASTLDLKDDMFLSGDAMHFLGMGSSKIENMGTISCREGDIHLISTQVFNEGKIEAQDGDVRLAAGYDVLLKPAGRERIFIRPRQFAGNMKLAEGLTNSGDISASNVELSADGSLYTHAINLGGRIEALTVHKQDSRIFLSVPRGHARISGQLVGDLLTDEKTHTIEVRPEAKLSGKRIDLCACENINFYGSARAPEGTITLSAKRLPNFLADVQAEEVVLNVSNGIIAGVHYAVPSETPKQDFLSAFEIQRALNHSNVTVRASEGDLTVAYPLLWSGDGSITLDAKGHLRIQSQVIAQGKGSVCLKGNDLTIFTQNGSHRSGVHTALGNIHVAAMQTLTIQGSPFEKGKAHLTANLGDITLEARSCHLRGESAGAEVIAPAGSLTLNVHEHLDLSGSDGWARLVGYSGVHANSSGDITIGKSSHVNTTDGHLFLAAKRHLTLQNGSHVTTSGKAQMTLCSDFHQGRVKKHTAGNLTIEAEATLMHPAGPIKVFSAGRGYNSIKASVNGRDFNFPRRAKHHAREQWGITFWDEEIPNTGSNDFVFYYKNGPHPSNDYSATMAHTIHETHNPHIENETGKLYDRTGILRMLYDRIDFFGEDPIPARDLDDGMRANLEMMGEYFSAMGEHEKAKAIYQTLFDSDPKNLYYLHQLAREIAEGNSEDW